MPSLTRDIGLVLRLRDFAETDRIVTVLTQTRGKLPVLVKGARRIASRHGGALDLANTVELVYYVRKGLQLLKEVALVQPFHARGDLEAVEAALRGLALVDRALPEGTPEPAAYRKISEYIDALRTPGRPEVTELAFSLQLLGAVGHRPGLIGCMGCGAEQALRWHPARGGLVCPSCGGHGPEVPPGLWRSLAALIRLPLDRAASVRFDAARLEQAQLLVRRFWDYHLGS